MTLQEMNKEELWQEFVSASEDYISFTANKHILECRGAPEFRLIKLRIHDVVDEMTRRKKRLIATHI